MYTLKSNPILIAAFLISFTFQSYAQSDDDLEAIEEPEAIEEIIKEEIIVEPEVEPIDESEQIFTIVEQMPEFEGGKQAMIEFLYGNLLYPEAAHKAGIEGLVVISFVVRNTGELTDIKILRDVGGGCGEEAARVVQLMNKKWSPGKQRGKEVHVSYKLPVRFKADMPKIDDANSNSTTGPEKTVPVTKPSNSNRKKASPSFKIRKRD